LRHIIREHNKIQSGGEIILSGECDGNHNIPLFISMLGEKGNDIELCNVDAIIKINETIRIIIEIEESGFLPTKICGKYLTSNLAKYYQYKKEPPIVLDSSNLIFIQVLDIQKQSEDKEKQFKHIETAIKNLIDVAEDNKFEHGCIKDYYIVPINAKQIKTLYQINEKVDKDEYDKSEYEKIKQIIEKELYL
jgi:hypothetical protein